MTGVLEHLSFEKRLGDLGLFGLKNRWTSHCNLLILKSGLQEKREQTF